MSPHVDPAVAAALQRGDTVRVIVGFDHAPTSAELAPYDVVFELASIDSAVLRITPDAFDRLLSDEHVVRIEADGEIRALD